MALQQEDTTIFLTIQEVVKTTVIMDAKDHLVVVDQTVIQIQTHLSLFLVL
jgi:hypothetical protein